MQVRFSPAIKGLITAALMIALSLLIDAKKETISPRIQYFVYLLYAAGIAWTLLSFRRSALFSGKFSELFNQGFRCFIVITLCMVGFTFVFVRSHPEYAEQEAKSTKEYYEAKGDKLAPEIEDLSQKAKKQYAITVISISIFRYLIIGAILAAALSALMIRRL